MAKYVFLLIVAIVFLSVKEFANFFYSTTVDPQIGISYSGSRFNMKDLMAIIIVKFDIVDEAENKGSKLGLNKIIFNYHNSRAFEFRENIQQPVLCILGDARKAQRLDKMLPTLVDGRHTIGC